MKMLISFELFHDLVVPHLTPRSLGLLSSTCKSMRSGLKDGWERQAVLVWNGFYRSEGGPKCSERYLAEHWTDEEEWSDWGDILYMMAIYGDTHKKVLHWITRDPKEVVRYELEYGFAAGELGGKRAWIEDAEDAWWESKQEQNDEDYCVNKISDVSSDELSLSSLSDDEEERVV